MPNTVFTQDALAKDSSFFIRVRNILITQAFVVLAEAVNTPFHAERVNYARQILNDSVQATNRVLPTLVNRTNLMAFTTSYDFVTSKVVTAAGDPDILSQISTDWNIYAGVNGS